MQIFMLFLIHAYSTRVWKRQDANSSTVSAAAIEHGFQSPEGHSKLIMDGPWWLLWPCLLIWPCFEGVIGFGFIHNALGETPFTTVFQSSECVNLYLDSSTTAQNTVPFFMLVHV